MSTPEHIATSEAYVDALFGPGAGKKHSQFLERIQNPALRELVHRFHAWESDTSQLSLEENYLIGMCVMCATGAVSTASMFAKVLLHLGTPKEKILEALGRLSMWSGGLAATEATFAIQRAIREYEKEGVASLAAWFPEAAPAQRESKGGPR